MRHKTRRVYVRTRVKITCIYSCVIELLIAVILLTASIMMYHSMKEDRKMEFENVTGSLLERVEASGYISNEWLMAMEESNHMLIFIEDNGIMLKSHGSWMPLQKREEIYQVFLYQEEHSMAAASQSEISGKSQNFYECKLEQNEYRIGVVKKSHLQIVVIQPEEDFEQFRHTLLVYGILILVVAFLLLYLLNDRLVGHILKPVVENDRSQQEFIASASHELKAPFAAILSSVNSLCMRPEEMEHYAEYIRTESKRGAGLVDQLLLLTASDQGKYQLYLQPVEIDTMLFELYETYEGRFMEAGIGLDIDTGEDISEPILADEERLKQVIIILLENALQHSQSRQPVELRKREEDHYIYIDVADHGKGIPEEEKVNIFRAFYQVDASHTQKSNYGLGLSIAEKLIKMQHGKIACLDTANGGATFTIRLVKHKKQKG